MLSASDTESNDEVAKPSLVAKTHWPEEDKINDALSTQQVHKAVSAKYCPTIVSSRDIDYPTKSIREDLGFQTNTKRSHGCFEFLLHPLEITALLRSYNKKRKNDFQRLEGLF